MKSQNRFKTSALFVRHLETIISGQVGPGWSEHTQYFFSRHYGGTRCIRFSRSLIIMTGKLLNELRNTKCKTYHNVSQHVGNDETPAEARDDGTDNVMEANVMEG